MSLKLTGRIIGLPLLAINMVLCFSAFAQTTYKDVVYLKNGSVIRGVIIEQVPGKSIKIETTDKSLFVVQMEEVERMVKEQVKEQEQVKEEPVKKPQPAVEQVNSNKVENFNKKGYVGLSIGLSAPTGDFGSMDKDNKNAGLANLGGIFDLSAGYRFGKYFGLSLLSRGESHAMDAQPLVDNIAKVTPAGVRFEVKTGFWRLRNYMIGGYGSYPIAQKVRFESRLMLGLLSASSPELEINYPDLGLLIKQSSTAAISLSYLLGAGLKFSFDENICILANVDYMGGKADFRNVETTSSLGTSERSSFSQSFGALNFGVGVGYMWEN